MMQNCRQIITTRVDEKSITGDGKWDAKTILNLCLYLNPLFGTTMV